MTPNWIEEFKQKWTECNCNKGFDYGQCERMEVINGGHGMARNDIINFITTLLEKKKEEYVDMIEKLEQKPIYEPYWASEETFINTKNDIINLIKSHDKTS